MMYHDWEKVGQVWVDSGTIAVGDPCYTIGPDATAPVEDWSEYLKKTWPMTFDNKPGTPEARNAEMMVAPVMGRPGIGIVVSSGYGDGTYPVYVRKNHEGRVMGVMVDFEDAGWED